MHIALKNHLYKDAKAILEHDATVLVWTGYDDYTLDGATEITNLNDLKKVFKYTYNMGWPIIRVDSVKYIE